MGMENSEEKDKTEGDVMGVSHFWQVEAKVDCMRYVCFLYSVSSDHGIVGLAYQHLSVFVLQ